MQEVIADLRAEQAALDQLLAHLPDADWLIPTPAAGWDIRDSVYHLAFFDIVALECVEGRGVEAWDNLRKDLTGEEDPGTQLIKPGRLLQPLAVLTQWREGREKLNQALLKCEPNQKIYWGGNYMAARSFATARLMECWAHGLDCFAAVGAKPVDNARLRHICHIGYRALPYAFRKNKLEMSAPLEDLRLELTAPDGTTWVFGSNSANQLISGAAGEWARVAVQRMPVQAATTLTAKGLLAEQALQVAQAFL